MKATATSPPHVPGSGMRQGVVLFTTCDLGGGRSDEMLRLLASVRSAESAGQPKELPIHHYILLQRAPGGVPSALEAAVGPSARLLAIDGRVSLSRARNMLLSRAREDGALARALWVAFPDDDAWYPPSLLDTVNALFTASASLTLVTCRYGTQPVVPPPAAGISAFRPLRGYGELIRVISSNTMMVRASAVEAAGGFDERLGVGARINGGEDLDYALRALACCNGHVIVSDRTLVGHRDRMRWVRSRYFAGSLFALARAARIRPPLAVHVLRKLLVGASLVALRELSASELRRGIRTGLAGWFTPVPEISAPEADPRLFIRP